MRPEWLAGNKHQCVDQIQCMKQKNSQTISYCLIAKDVKVKEGILNRQKLCKKFDQMTLEIQKKSEKANSIELCDDEA